MVEISEETYKKILSDHRKWVLLKTTKLSTGEYKVKNANEYNKILEATINLVEDDVNKMGEGIKDLIKDGEAE